MITENFRRAEFACPCCGLDSIDPDLVYLLQELRDYLDRPIIVTSGCRCAEHNSAVGGSTKSQHLLNREPGYCHAADIVVQDILDEMDIPGLGRYEDFTHADTRSGYARW